MSTMMELLDRNIDRGTTEFSLTSTYNNEQILYRSCLIGDLERVQYLLRVNTSTTLDLNRRNDNGLTLLHFGCLSNFYGLVQILLQYDANDHLRDHSGRTCLHYACIKGHRALVNLLLNNSTMTTKEDRFATRQQFVHWNDDQGKTSLDYACEQGHIDIVELLLEYTDLNEIDLTSSLCHASVEGHLDVCHLLLRKQQQQQQQQNKTNSLVLVPSVVQTICNRGHIQVLRLLVRSINSPSIPARRDSGNSVLFYCITTFDTQIIEELLERQIRLTEKDIHDLIELCPQNDDRIRVESYFDCLEFLFRYRLNFDESKISKYFLRQLCERCQNSFMAQKLKHLFALALYNGSIPLHRRATAKWCGEISIATRRNVQLTDVMQQASRNWSLSHILRLKIRRMMNVFTIQHIKQLPGLQEHQINFLSFAYL